MVYKLPTDDDGVKYHGVVDADGENPGQVLYGVDEHGNYRPVKVDNDGNVLTQVTGSIVEYIAEGEKVPIPAGATVEVIPNIDVSMYRYIFVQVKPMGLRNYEVRYFPTRADGNDTIYSYELLKVENSR